MSSHMRFCVLYLGRMDFKRKHLLANGDGEENIRCLVPAILIEHPVLGNILYDTGNSPLSSTVYSEYTNENFPVTEFVSVESALKEKGIAPSDIDLLIISHLHFDHAGGMAYFKGTKAAKNVYIAEGDLRNAYYDALTRGGISPYCKESFDLEGIQFHPISGETALAEDLILFPQECHTPGVTGLILKTQNNGNVIATSDTIYTRYSFENQVPPGGDNAESKKDFFKNLERVKRLQRKYYAALFFGHDEEQIKEWSNRGWMD